MHILNTIGCAFIFIIFFLPGDLRCQDLLQLNPNEPLFHIQNQQRIQLKDGEIILIMPGISALYSNIGPSFSDLIQKNASGKYALNPRHALLFSEEENMQYSRLQLSCLGLAFSVKGFTVSLGHSLLYSGILYYPESFLEVYAYGNAPFIGVEKEIGLEYELQSLHAYSLGISKRMKKFDIGIQVDIYSGIQGLNTEQSKISFLTENDFYQLRFDNDYRANSSNLLEFKDFNNLRFNFSENVFNNTWSNNNGVGYAFSAVYNISGFTKMQAILSFQRKITWEEKLKNYTSKKQYVYEGVDISDYIGSDAEILLTDSLYQLLRIDSSSQSFESKMPFIGRFSVKTQIQNDWNISGDFEVFRYRNRNYFTLETAVYRFISERLYIGPSLTYGTVGKFQIGLQSSFIFGPLYMRAGTTNILGILDPLGARSTNFWLGIMYKIQN